MDFSLSEEQTALQELARQILTDRLTPDRLREVEQEPEAFDRKLWKDLAEANLLGLAIAEKHGGMGFGFLEVCLLLEEIGRAVAPLPALPTLVLGALPLEAFGTDAQRERFLPGVVAGDLILTAAIADAEQVLATTYGSGWRLDGIRTLVPAAHLAARILVPTSAGLFLVEREADGVELEHLETTNGEPHFRITLSGVEVGEQDRLGTAAQAPEILDWLSQRATAAYAALQLGVSDRALRMTAEYTSEREQFKRKLSTFQAVAQRAANAYVDVEALRLTVQQAVWRLSEGLDAAREVAIAKYWAGDTGHRVSYAAQHLHGGIGVDIDYPLHRYCLWSKQIELTLGSSTEQLLALGARLAAEPA